MAKFCLLKGVRGSATYFSTVLLIDNLLDFPNGGNWGEFGKVRGLRLHTLDPRKHQSLNTKVRFCAHAIDKKNKQV